MDRIPIRLREEVIRIVKNKGTFGQVRNFRQFLPALRTFQVVLLANANVRVVARILARET